MKKEEATGAGGSDYSYKPAEKGGEKEVCEVTPILFFFKKKLIIIFLGERNGKTEGDDDDDAR